MCKRQEAAHVSLPAMLVQAGSGSGKKEDATCSADAGVGGVSATMAGAQPCLAATGLEPLAEEGQEGEAEEEAEDSAGGGTSAQREPPTSAALAGAAAGAAAPLQAAQAGSGAGTAPSGGAAAAAEAGGWLWRTPLEQSAPFWEGWYTGLSEMFLKLPVPKVGYHMAVQLGWHGRLAPPGLRQCGGPGPPRRGPSPPAFGRAGARAAPTQAPFPSFQGLYRLPQWQTKKFVDPTLVTGQPPFLSSSSASLHVQQLTPPCPPWCAPLSRCWSWWGPTD